MNIALIANLGVLAPVQNLMRWWAASRSPAIRVSALPKQDGQSIAPKFIAPHAITTGATGSSCVIRKPLRVVRVVEAGQARACVGRMVISGRMADVCAELDRLAAREAALS